MTTPEERIREAAERIRRRARGLPEEPPKPHPKPAADAEAPDPHWSELAEQDEREEA